MSELKITKEAVLAAAAKCSTAKETLKTLFPEVFEEEKKPLFPDGWKVIHPNGRLIMRGTQWNNMCHNHLFLNDDAFHFEIVKAHDCQYLKVTPK